MHYDFSYYNPTIIYFGKTALDHLKDELAKYGPNILLAYGGGSIKKIGLYDKVIEILKDANKNVIELPGIMPNPTVEVMLEGARLVRENNVDLILAVGGGSVIDCAKGISVSAYCSEDPFVKYWIEGKKVDNKIVPVGSILTMTGTASEMNGGSVITDHTRMVKLGHVFPPEVYPKFSLLNPELTYTVSKYQMVSGIFDIFSHLMEQYFSGEDDNVTDYLIEAILRSLIVNTKIAINNPHDYDARSNIMWASTLALNTITGKSKTQDWEVHGIEHQISAYTNCAHGMGLAAISPAYYRYIYRFGLQKFVRFAVEVWKINPVGKTPEETALAGIDALANFIEESGMCTNLKDIGVTPELIPLIANSSRSGGGYYILNNEDILKVLLASYKD